MIPLTLVGGGRMGRAIAAAAEGSPEFEIQGVLVRGDAGPGLPGSPPLFRELDAWLDAAPRTVVLDFSSPHGFEERVEAVARGGHPLVEGTTGLSEDAGRILARAAERIPVVAAPNTSAGIALLRRALRTILEARGASWHLSVLDRHHRHKKDAPSGTAGLLAGDVRDRTGASPEVAAFRHGGVAGEHTVYAVGEEEELVFTHRAFSRGVFARGALVAAAFAWKAEPGLYTMEDALE